MKPQSEEPLRGTAAGLSTSAQCWGSTCSAKPAEEEPKRLPGHSVSPAEKLLCCVTRASGHRWE